MIIRLLVVREITSLSRNLCSIVVALLVLNLQYRVEREKSSFLQGFEGTVYTGFESRVRTTRCVGSSFVSQAGEENILNF